MLKLNSKSLKSAALGTCWHLLAAALLVFVPTALIIGVPIWSRSLEQAAPLAGLVLAYMGTALILSTRLLIVRKLAFRDVAVVGASLFGISFLLLIVSNITYSRRLVFGTFLLATFLLVMFFAASRLRWFIAASKKFRTGFRGSPVASRNPESFAPGTLMQVEGIADPTARAMLIDYLKKEK